MLRLTDTELSRRKEQILSAIIESFILTGEPVGSKFLAASLPFTVSSATIRNEMAALYDGGFLDQPHTSAGRVPSDKGYRYYIERLLVNFAPSRSEMFRVMSAVDAGEGDPEELLGSICSVLSELTGLAVAAVTPSSPETLVEEIRAVPLGSKNIMVVVTTASGTLKSRVARLSAEPSYDDLNLFYKLSSACFKGAPVGSIDAAGLQNAAMSLGEKTLDLLPLLVSLYDAAAAAGRPGVIVRGYANLLSSSLAEAAGIIELLRDENAARRILGKTGGNEITMKIGAENDYSCLKRAAVIRAGFSSGDGPGGVIALIGPTKIDYAKKIALLKYVAGVAGQSLSALGGSK